MYKTRYRFLVFFSTNNLLNEYILNKKYNKKHVLFLIFIFSYKN